MRSILLLAALASLAVVTYAAPATAPAPAKIEAVGLRIVAEALNKDDSTRAFNWTAGTTLALRLTIPEGSVLALTSKKINSLKDDKGTDLTKGLSQFDGFPRISVDSKSFLVEVETSTLPAKGATKLTLKADLTLSVGTTKKSTTLDNVALKEGTLIKGSGIQFKITKVSKPDFGEDEMQITLHSDKPTESLAAIEFQDAQGKTLKAQRAGSSSYGDSIDIDYAFPKKTATAKIILTEWIDAKPLTIPVNLTIPLGL